MVFVINDNFNECSFQSSHLPLKMKVVQWIHLKQIKLSSVMLNISHCGIPFCSTTAEVQLKINTTSIVQLSFSPLPLLQRTSKNVSEIQKRCFMSKTVQFINSCSQLKVLCFQYEQYNNQLIVELDPIILKQLRVIKWWSCAKLYKQKSTMSVLMEHCTSLTCLVLFYGRRSKEYESVTEQMLIRLVMKNKKLQTIKFTGVNATDKLLNTMFTNCKMLKSLILYTKEPFNESQLLLQCIVKFVWRTLYSHSISINTNGCAFGPLLCGQKKNERHFFNSQIIDSEKVYHDLVQLSQTPALKYICFSDRVLYKEDEFVLWGVCKSVS
jgi:hypothetical protein